MVVAVVVVAVTSFQRKLGVGNGGGVTRDYFEANVTFYIAVAMGLGILSNSIRVLFTEGDSGTLWTLIDIICPPLFVSAGIRLLRSSSGD